MGKLNIIIGDIVSNELLKGHDLIINPTNPRMVCGAGVSQAIFHKAGVDELENYTQKKYNISYFTDDNLMKIGEIRITPGFNLGIDIMFVQGPKAYEYEYNLAKKILLETYKNMINEAYSNGYKNILCPSLGTGNYYFKHEDIGKDVITYLNNLIDDKDINIDFILYDEQDKQYYI